MIIRALYPPWEINKYDSIGELSFNHNISKSSSTLFHSHNWSSEHHSPQCHIRICGANIQGPHSFSGFSTRRKLISFGRASIYWWFSLWQRHARHSSSSKTGRYSPRKHLLLFFIFSSGTRSAAVLYQHSIRSQTLLAKNPSTTSHISAQHSFLGNLKEN